MKRFSFVLALTFANVVVAAPLDYFNAVINHNEVLKHILDGAQLESVKHTMTYRCLGCYSFELVFDTANGKQKHTATTKLIKNDMQVEVTFAAAP